MKEIEIKILDINEEETMQKVISLKAKKIDDVLIHEKYYDFDDKRLTTKKRNTQVTESRE